MFADPSENLPAFTALCLLMTLAAVHVTYLYIETRSGKMGRWFV